MYVLLGLDTKIDWECPEPAGVVIVDDTGKFVITEALETALFVIITFAIICPLEDGVTGLLRGIWRGLLPEVAGFAVMNVGFVVGIWFNIYLTSFDFPEFPLEFNDIIFALVFNDGNVKNLVLPLAEV